MTGPARFAGTSFVSSMTSSWLRSFFGGLGLSVAASMAVASAPVKVEGYFCDAKADQLAFLHKKAGGDNEIMASNAVNKATGKASCMPYIVADAVPVSEQTVIDDGLVFVLRSYRFMPENVERWHGAVSGSLVQSAQTDRDI
jgi:hypothetical protein